MLPELLTSADPDSYQTYIEQKTSAARQRLEGAGIVLPEVAVYPSEPVHYRMRSEFGVFHRDGGFDYVMYKKGKGKSETVVTNSFNVHARCIDALMPDLREEVCREKLLKDKLFEADFLANSKGHVIAALQYHKPLDTAFGHALSRAAQNLRDRGHSTDLAARARKQLVKADTDALYETYELGDATLRLRQVIGYFSQPNAGVCTQMLRFVRACAKETESRGHDLLELYCGSGTFTIALAPLFRSVIATEISREALRTAEHNLAENGISNTTLLRLSAGEMGMALYGHKAFNRLAIKKVELGAYSLRTLFIDPPRMGLRDEASLRLTASFDNIIYVSCGLESLIYDLRVLCKSHEVSRIGFFDQFPYTNHLETIVFLTRTNKLQ